MNVKKQTAISNSFVIGINYNQVKYKHVHFNIYERCVKNSQV